MTMLCLCVLGYLGMHGIGGRHGLDARQRLDGRTAALAREIEELDAQRRALNRDVALLSDVRPDPDFIAELAADVLNFARPGDRIVSLRTMR
jgi:cell division protein FtsB